MEPLTLAHQKLQDFLSDPCQDTCTLDRAEAIAVLSLLHTVADYPTFTWLKDKYNIKEVEHA